MKCNIGFTMVGEPYTACVKGRWDSPKPICIKQGCKLGELRNGRVKTSYDNAFLEFSCDPGFRLVGPDFMYCDGISWNAMQPYCQASDVSCNFESNNICNWVYEKKIGDELIWQIHEMAAPSRLLRTGPAHDHTYLANSTQKGHYLMIETSDPSSYFPFPARIQSPRFSPVVENSCFVFWYHMFGTTIGRLNVFLNGRIVFHEKGNHGDRWNKGVVPLSVEGPNDMQITVEATYGGGYTGDIAVDDFSVGNGTDCISPKDLSCEGRCYEESNISSICQCSPECYKDSSCCDDFMEMCNLETTRLPIVTDNLETSDTTFGIFSTYASTVVPFEESSTFEMEIIMKSETDVSTTTPDEHPNNFDTEIVMGNNDVTTVSFEETNNVQTEITKTDNFSEMSTTEQIEETSSATEINGNFAEDYESSNVKSKPSTNGMRNMTYDELKLSFTNSTTTEKNSINTTPKTSPRILNGFQQNTRNNTGSTSTTMVLLKNYPNEKNNSINFENNRSTIRTKRVTQFPTIKENTNFILTKIMFTRDFHITKNTTDSNNVFIKPTTTIWNRTLMPVKVSNASKSILKDTTQKMFDFSTTESNRKVFYKGNTTANVLYNFTLSTKNSENSSSSEIKNVTTTAISVENVTIANLQPSTVTQNSSFESSEKLTFNYSYTYLPTEIPTSAIRENPSTIPQTTLKFWQNVLNKKPTPTKWKSKYKPKERLIFTVAASVRPNTSVIVAWVCIGVVFTTAIITSVILYFKKRQRQRFINGTEEADILYTSSDELLDFQLARPGTSG